MRSMNLLMTGSALIAFESRLRPSPVPIRTSHKKLDFLIPVVYTTSGI